MRIAVIGAGNVGGTLGRRWAQLGHTVAFGVRHPEHGPGAVKGSGDFPPQARVVSLGGAVNNADVIVLATPWGAVNDALNEMGAESGALDGKTLIDAVNPIGPNLSLDVGPDGMSAAERIQKRVPTAHVVKAFNTTGFDNMEKPEYDGAPTVMFYAGDNADAKAKTRELVSVLGFDPVDAGPLKAARELEHWAILWISLAFGAGGAEKLGRDFAFRLVKR